MSQAQDGDKTMPFTEQEKLPGSTNKQKRLAPKKVALRRLGFQEHMRSYRAEFHLWRLRRPFWGSVLMILGGILILWGPASPTVLRFALLPGSTIWAALLIGALLLVMGLIQMFAPSLSTFTGSVGVVLSIISIIVALGGFVIGMLFGIIGGALGVAWRPNARRLPNKTAKKGSRVSSRPRFFKSV
ncbi:MAG TPA: DUF6114 domain-containing protein [Ktedonobacteraceae bacterium]|jgi:hypothetical protein